MKKTFCAIILAVIVCAMIVVFSVGMSYYNEPARVANRELEALAKYYYENSFYQSYVEPLLAESSDEDIKRYKEVGFQPVYLRELLLFDNEKYRQVEKHFSGNYICDTNATSVIYYVVGYGGKNDYKIDYKLVCEYSD